MTNNFKSEAKKCAELGWNVFPCRAKTKKPATENGFKDATIDITQINEWWGKNPRYNVAIRTGKESGIFVVDVDNKPEKGKYGSNTLTLLEEEYGVLPDTVYQCTGGGGTQYFFRYPEGVDYIPSRNECLGEGIDIKADGGYVIAPPSIHPDSGKAYEWEMSSTPWDQKIADPPEWLIEKVAQKKKSEQAAPQARRNAAEIARDLELARQALEFVPADDRNVWVHMGMALNSTGTGDFAYQIWTEWSKKSEKYDPADQQRTWDSFGNNSGIELGTLFHNAKEHGWPGQRNVVGNPRLENENPPKDQPPIFEDAPVIKIIEGMLPQMTDQAEQYLIASGEEIYQRGQMLVRPIEVDAGIFGAVQRKVSGMTILQEVDATYLIDCLTRNVNFEKYDGRSQKWVPKNCPKSIAETLLARKGRWHFPRLKTIVHTPIIKFDGSILDEPGHDPDTGVLYRPNCRFDNIPRRPTKKDAEKSLLILRKAVHTFPFVSEADESVAIAGILTGFVRASVKASPMIVFSSPVAGSGKSKLVDGISIIATGKPAAVVGQGTSEAETEKRLHSSLLQGDQIVCLDNIAHPLEGQALCQMVTQQMLKIRILGKSKVVDVPNVATLFGTGNNVIITGDMPRRSLLCQLDPKCERPEERTFNVDFLDYMSKNRPEIIHAAMTILRAFHCAGKPDMGLKPMGSFKQWSLWVREALVWLGLPDPLKTREAIRNSDPDLINLRNLLHSCYELFEEAEFTLKDLIGVCRTDEDSSASPLDEAILDIAGDKHEIDRSKLGRFMGEHKNRIVDGLKIEKSGTIRGAAKWRVVEER